jgi:putative methyltransferase
MNNIYLFQPNFKIGAGNFLGYWLPYSIGCLWSYARQSTIVSENYVVKDIIFKREDPNKLMARLDNPSVCAFSCYMWNWEYTKHIAQRIKETYPDCTILFGGPQITDRPEEEKFFEKHPYVDTISLAEGEEAFTKMLETKVAGEPLEKIYELPRLVDLDIPSPYLDGTFDKIIADNPDVIWNGTLETNRGCPFACTFCDWGSLTYAKIKKFPIPKVIQELTWMAENKIDYVTIADANFGVFKDRDMEVTERLVELQNEYGYPKVVDATWYKNSSEDVLKIVKKFISSGLNRGITLSVQSMDMDVLEEIKRRNMEFSNLKEIFDICNKEQIPSYTELILGLPQETFESWCKGLCDVIEMGQHNAIESWLAQLLENAHMNTPGQHNEHQYDVINVKSYVSSEGEEDDIEETVDLIRGTKYMPRDKFIDSWLYSWMINNFHNYGWTQMLSRFVHKYSKVSYLDFYNTLWGRIHNDKGFVNKEFNKAKEYISRYLETGEADGFNGHTLMWDAQKDFHINRKQVLEFIKTSIVNSYGIDEEIFEDLIQWQEDFVTSYDLEYPMQVKQNYNFHEFITDEECKHLININKNITVNLVDSFTDKEDYLNRMYYKRRQGWGKVRVVEDGTQTY